jgi:hypothetical protein
MNYIMGPAILVTVGTLWLLNNLHVVREGTFFAVILIVIGGIKLLQSSASTEGHRQPNYMYAGMGGAQAAQTPQAPAPSENQPAAENRQVNNG